MKRLWIVFTFCLAVAAVSTACGTSATGVDEDAVCVGASCDAGDAGDAEEVDAMESAPDVEPDTFDGEFVLEDMREEDTTSTVDDVWDEDASEEDLVQDVIDDMVAEDTTADDTSMPPADTMQPPQPEPPKSFKIRFATYNVRTSNLNNSAWGDNHVGWDSNDADRMVRIADTIAAQNLTVVAAQEMRRAERDRILTRLANAHGENWGHSTYKQGRDDTAIIFDKSVWKFIRETHYLIPMQPGLEDRYQVGALLEHKSTGRRVWFYSVHLAAGGSGGANARKTGAQKTVTSIKNRAVDNDLPFVLGGDFNAAASDAPGDILRNSGVMRYTRNIADKRVGNGCKTLNSNAGSAGNQSCPGGAARHIDHVWIGKTGMKVLKYQVTATAHTSRSSDHNPLTTILEQP